MPLKIITARKATKANNLYIRGSYLGVAVDRSCRTDKRSVARALLKRIEQAIERGEYPPREENAKPEPTFLSAAAAYLKSGHRARYVAMLVRHFGETPLSEIDQAAIDQAALTLKPNVTASTRNTAVYTPVSAILRHAGHKLELRRPKGAKGRVVTDWLVPEDAFGIIEAAEAIDAEFAVLLKFLLYTGLRLGEALALSREDLRLPESLAWIRREKGGAASDVRLRADLRDALAVHVATHDRRRVFRFHQGGHLKHFLVRAKLAYLGIACPARRPKGWRPPPYRLRWVNFHTFRHTWATWMRQSGTDVLGLVATENWRDPRSAARYSHAVARQEWEAVERLPAMGKRRETRS